MIVDLGRTGYEEAYKAQRDLVKRRILGEVGDSCILVEHPPVFTIGRSGGIRESILKKDEIERSKIKILPVDRGGGITFHGPGQVVVYPVVDLKIRGRDLHRYMRDLEGLVINFFGEYSVKGERAAGKTGVWAGGRKLAFIGVAATNWVTYHGVSVNLDVDLEFFSMITPCGLKGVRIGNLSDVARRPIDMSGAKLKVLRHFSEVFGVARNADCAPVG